MFSIDDETTRGPSGVPMMRWPRAMTSAGTADAAIADATAYRRWVRLTFRCHLRHGLVGENIRPPRHMLPKAAWPERWVPPPWTRGIRETARPVADDAAVGASPSTPNTVQVGRLMRTAATGAPGAK